MDISLLNPNYFSPPKLSLPFKSNVLHKEADAKSGKEKIASALELISEKIYDGNLWRIFQRNGYLDFSYNHTQTQSERLSFNGYYAESTNVFSMNLKYVFQKNIQTETGIQQRTFLLNFSFDKKVLDKLNMQFSEEKEDIVSYLKRLVNEIVETAYDEDKLLLGAKIDLEEFIEIVGIEDGKFIKMIHSLIQTIVNFTLRKLMEEKKEAEPVIVEVERKKNMKIKLDYSHESKRNFNLEIIDISSDDLIMENKASENGKMVK